MFDIWTSKNVFGDSPLTYNEIKIIEVVNMATEIKFEKNEEEEIMILETPTHRVVVVGKGGEE